MKVDEAMKSGDIRKALQYYMEIPFYLPQSDHMILCGIMKELAFKSGLRDLDIVFNRIITSDLTRKHPITLRTLMRVGCELQCSEIILETYKIVCQEKLQITNPVLTDVLFDCLGRINRNDSICAAFTSIQKDVEMGAPFPDINNQTCRSIADALLQMERPDTLHFLLASVKKQWVFPVYIVDYIASSLSSSACFADLLPCCLSSQPKSATLYNSIIRFYVREGEITNALSCAAQARKSEVSLPVADYQAMLEHLLHCRPETVDKQLVVDMLDYLCNTNRGGFIITLGVLPLEVMGHFQVISKMKRYLAQLISFDKGLQLLDIEPICRIAANHSTDSEITAYAQDCVRLINKNHKIG